LNAGVKRRLPLLRTRSTLAVHVGDALCGDSMFKLLVVGSAPINQFDDSVSLIDA